MARVTIRDVARVTGLSPAAVSYALRGQHTSAETQRRVRRAAAELGYEAHPIARALASGKTGMVGLICGSLEDFWQQSLAVEIGRALLAVDRYAIILDAADDPVRERELARQLKEQQVDGLIVQPIDPSAPFWAELAAELPVVSIGDSLTGNPHGEVVFDNEEGLRLVLGHLAGHRIAVLTPTPLRVGLPPEIEVILTPSGLAESTAVARELLVRPDRPTAVFCLSDSIAYGVYAATRELSLEVPDEISVCGYDAHPLSALLSPPLTTVDWDLPEVAADSVRLVVGAIEEQTHRRIVRKPRLCPRTSTASITD
ncbi:LacI family DNA-binding transcriptional regulator [Actinocorallia longicatena]|uniref:LacI family DNA-binding transcriptional regulator n=1 Tax=Actinocorallia longicatena TaxID=111803 RepID=A0ABP6Q2H1_9ACTN